MNVPDKYKPQPVPVFRWKYILLPTFILVLSLVLTAIFYPRLPEQLGYHFQGDGSPDRWLGRNQIIAAMLLPQFMLTLLAGATAGVMLWMSVRLRPVTLAIKPEGIFTLMGNMMALPEIVLAFAMLEIFIYNVYRVHLMPIWLFAAIVMVSSGVIIGIFFLKAVREARRATQ